MSKNLNNFEISGLIESIVIRPKVAYAKIQMPSVSKSGKKINKFISIPFFEEMKKTLEDFKEGQEVHITGELVGGYTNTYVAARAISLESKEI